MTMRAAWVIGLLGLGATAIGSCGSGPKLIKWVCACGSACAETEGEAASVTQYNCYSSGSANKCTPTGDMCACPGDAERCEITPP